MALGAVGGDAGHVRAHARVRARSARRSAARSASFQAIRHKLAEMATKIEAGRDLTYHGAAPVRRRARTRSRRSRWRSCSPADAAVEVADEAVQIHGGYGYMREYDVERALRDARLGPIGGGTDEIMKEIIGKQLGL